MNALVVTILVIGLIGFISLILGIFIYIYSYLKELKKIKEEDKFGPR